MRLLVATFASILGLTLPASAQPVASPDASRGVAIQNGAPTLAPLVKKVTPSVVNIAVKGKVAQAQNPLLNDPFFRRFFELPDVPTEREIQAAGSGVIVDAQQGLIVTNNHVVEHADEIAVTLNDGRRFVARRLSADPETDIAIIRISAENLIALPLGDSDKLEVGDFVVAVGNPFGLGQTVTAGIVSALRRTGLGIKGYEDFIQTDAPINPGNSGGALVSLRGELVGINTAIIGPSGGNVGIGFAIPANLVRDVMAQLSKYGEVRRGRLGVVIQDLSPDLAQAMGLDARQSGAVVAKVEAGSPADSAGLKAGDVVTELGKAPVRSAADLRNKIGMMRVGETAELTVLRGGRATTIRVTLTAPVRKVVQGGEISPLLEGASFGELVQGATSGGVEIVAMQAGSKAERAGLRKGDVVTSVNQQPVAGLDALAVKARESPKHLLLNVLRDGNALFIVLRG